MINLIIIAMVVSLVGLVASAPVAKPCFYPSKPNIRIINLTGNLGTGIGGGFTGGFTGGLTGGLTGGYTVAQQNRIRYYTQLFGRQLTPQEITTIIRTTITTSSDSTDVIGGTFNGISVGNGATIGTATSINTGSSVSTGMISVGASASAGASGTASASQSSTVINQNTGLPVNVGGVLAPAATGTVVSAGGVLNNGFNPAVLNGIPNRVG